MEVVKYTNKNRYYSVHSGSLLRVTVNLLGVYRDSRHHSLERTIAAICNPDTYFYTLVINQQNQLKILAINFHSYLLEVL